MADAFDFVVIGAGSGGLASAQRAAEYGAKVAIVEPAPLGGTCVNLGCVPKKVMWNAADIADGLEDAADYGFRLGAAEPHDWALLKTKRDAYVARLNTIYETNLAKRHIEVVRGWGSFADPHTVLVGERKLTAPNILIAVGGRPMVPDIPGADLCITSDGFFALQKRPDRVAVVGSGYIAVELAGILGSLGAKATLVLRGHRALKDFDAMLGEGMLKIMRDEGIEVATGAWPSELRRTSDGDLELDTRDGRKLGPFDTIICAIGRVPAVHGLGLERAGVELDAYGFIV